MSLAYPTWTVTLEAPDGTLHPFKHINGKSREDAMQGARCYHTGCTVIDARRESHDQIELAL
jgi:hypothetical protein